MLLSLFYIMIGFLMYWGVILCISEIMNLNTKRQDYDSDSEGEEEYIEAVPIAKATLIRSLTV